MIGIQFACAAVWLYDVAISTLALRAAPVPWHLHELFEIGAILGLILGLVMGLWLLRTSHRRAAEVEARLDGLSGAFHEHLNARFTDWGLTEAERDVAWFTLKGLSNAEIAALRGAAPGTIKAQCNGIYRKAGVTGRPQLLSLFLEDLLVEPPLTPPQDRSHR